MKTFPSLRILLLLCAAMTAKAETVTEYILDTVDSGDGYWPCLFYELNYQSDLALAEAAKWHAPDEDESYWRSGIGPFSIDQNKFFVTQWQSTLHPLLIRRHFTLDPDALAKIAIGTVTLLYSYDENPTFWLNGKKLVSATGWNDNNYDRKQLLSLQKKWLMEGDNVLCVSLSRGEGGGHIDYGLTVTYNPNHTDVSLPQEETEDCHRYNLLGQQLPDDTQQRGIVITQGKKLLCK